MKLKNALVLIFGLAFSTSAIGADVLYEQMANHSGSFGPAAEYIDDFVSPLFDNDAADDFVVTAASGWKINQVKLIARQVHGDYPVNTVNVNFYTDVSGLPGEPVCTYDDINFTDEGSDVFSVPLPADCVLGPGTYWFGFQGTVAYTHSSVFEWGLSTVQTGYEAAWRALDMGHGEECIGWHPRSLCQDLLPDHNFQILGAECDGTCPPVGACCEPNSRCSSLTSSSCGLLGWTYHGDGSDCALACPPQGACCKPDGSCDFGQSPDCAVSGGTYQGNFTTCSESCGACCHENGSCQQQLEQLCIDLGGQHHGEGSSCSTESCTGACCLPDDSCSVISDQSCDAAGGVYQGDGSDCDTESCTGACCDANGSCTEIGSFSCVAGGGSFWGFATSCATSSCVGACCQFDGSCSEETSGQCSAASGEYRGDGSLCVDQSCLPDAGACCLPGNVCSQNFTEDQCQTQDGYFHGVGVGCAVARCDKLLASDLPSYNKFGSKVGLSGNIAVVGSNRITGLSNAVYIFDRFLGGFDHWGQVKKIDKPYSYADGFGQSISIENDVLAVGAVVHNWPDPTFSSAFILDRNQGGTDNWGVVTRLVPSDMSYWIRFGWSISLSGDTVIVGAPYHGLLDQEIGAAYIFVRDPGGSNNWGQQKLILPPSPRIDGQFGISVALSGDTAVVGEPGPWSSGGSAVEAAHVYSRNHGGTGNWGLVKTISISSSGQPNFGWSVAISGDLLAVAAIGGDDPGAVYLYGRNQGGVDNWGQIYRLIAPNGGSGAFGNAVAVDGDTVIVGTPDRAAYVFRPDEGDPDNWGYVAGLTPFDGTFYDHFGHSVDIDNDLAIAGSPGDDVGNHPNTGSAYLFFDIPTSIADFVFGDDFESEGTSSWTAAVLNNAEAFNYFIAARGIQGDYILCSYDSLTGDYGYLGQVFNEADGALGGGPIAHYLDLYWKNEHLASTIEPYASDDADGDGVVNSLDADALYAVDQ